MTTNIEFSSAAFIALEALPQPIAFGIVALTDHLRNNLELGRRVQIRRSSKDQYRMLIYRGTHRIIYDYDIDDNCAYIRAVQDCRQKLPSARELKRDLSPDMELPLE